MKTFFFSSWFWALLCAWSLQPTDCASHPNITTLPPCSNCLAGYEDFGYLFSAVHDPSLQEVHIFADMKDSNEVPAFVDECFFTDPQGGQQIAVIAQADPLFDPHVYYTGYRIICNVSTLQVPRLLETAWVGLAYKGKHYAPRIPVTEVVKGPQAEVGGCVGIMYGSLAAEEQTKQFALHMHSMSVSMLHMYYTTRDIAFDENGEGWHHQPHNSPPQKLAGVEWVHVDSFPTAFRWLSGQQTAYNHCVFAHRHKYRYLAVWDTDEFIVLKHGFRTLPPFLDMVFSEHPQDAAAVFYRFAYRSGCTAPSRQESWHDKFNSREKLPESERLIKRQNWAHLLTGRGDKLVVKPLLVDKFYFHFLDTARENYSREGIVVKPQQAFLKHVRRYEGFDECSLLAQDDPML